MACDILLSQNTFCEAGFWNEPIIDSIRIEDISLFDQNGYDLTLLEQKYADKNNAKGKKHRSHIISLKNDWFTQKYKTKGAVLNHSLLFERKGYTGKALEQLESVAKNLPLIYKVSSLRPKWGLDFSMDYADNNGNAFEVLHWEYDSFSYEEISKVKNYIEPRLLSIDWDDAAKELLRRKEDWHHLNFFEQSDWKCNYFNIIKERFKMVIWK